MKRLSVLGRLVRGMYPGGAGVYTTRARYCPVHHPRVHHLPPCTTWYTLLPPCTTWYTLARSWTRFINLARSWTRFINLARSRTPPGPPGPL